MSSVKILDSTLREGEQSLGISFTKRQRLQLAWMLDYFGVDSIEISPVISDSHFESLKEMVRAGFSAQIISHGRALPEDIELARKCDAEWVAMYHSLRQRPAGERAARLSTLHVRPGIARIA